jgi:hypothetical protein
MQQLYSIEPMKGRARRPRLPAIGVRKVLAANLVAGMDSRFPEATDKVRALADASGVARSTIQRFLEIDVAGANIDTLSQLANALHCEAYELLMPEGFSVDQKTRRQERLPAR